MPELQQNSVGLHFHEGVEKIKENYKNTKIENLRNGQEKPRARVELGQKFEKNYNFFKFQFEIALNGSLDKFLTRISLHLPKEALNALRKIQFTIGTNF